MAKEGQNPFTQLKSLLQLDWLILRLRPSSVSAGSIEIQFDCTPQSPQPSQTAGLIMTRRAGSSIRPRLRRRRFEPADGATEIVVPSCTSTVNVEVDEPALSAGRAPASARHAHN